MLSIDKYSKFKTLVLYSLLLIGSNIQSQHGIKIRNLSNRDTSEKRFYMALIGNIGSNLLINRIDANIRNKEWAKVNFTDWKNNILNGFDTDYDHFSTNWLGHPLHGALYYNAARSNGYTYWQSIPFTFAGSLIWEFLGEKYYPSEIDIMTTTFGGTMLGEITFKLTDVIRTKKSSSTLKRVGQFVVNPIRTINGYFYPDSVNSSFPYINSNLTFGNSYIFGTSNNQDELRLNLDYTLEYGNIFEQNSSYMPFDYFYFRTWVNFLLNDRSNFYFNLTSYAPVYLKKINDNSLLAISQSYESRTNDKYKIGTASINLDYLFRTGFINTMEITSTSEIGYIVFGSTNSIIMDSLYYSGNPEYRRDYIYGDGYLLGQNFSITSKNYGKLMANVKKFFINTNRDAKVENDIMLVLTEYSVPIMYNMRAGFQIDYYRKNAIKDNFVMMEDNNSFYEIKAILSILF